MNYKKTTYKEFSKKVFIKKIEEIFTNRVVVVYLMIILALIVGEIITDNFVTFSHMMSILHATFFLGLIGLSQTIVILSGKDGIDLSVGPVITMGVLLGAVIINGEDKNILLAFLIVLVSGFVAGLINGVGVSFLKIQPLIMTLSWGITIEGIAYISTQGILRGRASPMLILIGGKSFKLTLAGYSINIPWVIIIWILLTIIIMFIFKRTPIGWVLYSIGLNDKAAKLIGIKTKLVRMLAYCFSGTFAALSGLFMLGYIRIPCLGLGEKYMLPSIVASILGGVDPKGGKGSYLGTIGGAILLVVIESILTTLGFGESQRQLVIGLVLIILLSLYSRKFRTI